MRLPAEFIRLPLRVDADRLAAEVAAAAPAAWRPHPQGHSGNTALPLVSTGGDPSDDSTTGPMLPTPHLAAMPYLRQVLAALGAPIGRTRLMRLDAGAEATPHVDINEYWADRVRVHVPVRSRPDVRFHCDERQAHMAPGEVWIFDTSLRHNVVNPGGDPRIHLVIDTAGSPAFDALVSAGEHNPEGPGGGGRFVGPAASEPELTFEPASLGHPLAHPVFVVCPPRSGSSLLFETLSGSPGLATIGGESHGLIEGIARLHPADQSWASNRLTAADATPDVVAELRRRFTTRLRDRDGAAPGASSEVCLLEKTPKNALRIPFLAAAFPGARFVYLYRDPVDTLASMVEGWRSGRFTTYPELPGWDGLPWSFLLVPGWQDLAGLPVPELAARQWSHTVEAILDDLAELPDDRWCVASYGRLLADPQSEIIRLCDFLDVAWDRQLEAPLPHSRTTLSPPAPGKWRRLESELAPVLPIVAGASGRARDLFASSPGPDRAAAAAGKPLREPITAEERAAGFTSRATAAFVSLLEALDSSLVVTTYQTGRVILIRAKEGTLNTHFRRFDLPMGVAARKGRLVLGTRREIWEYRDQPAVARKIEPAGSHDACYLPRHAHVTGDLRIHDVAIAGDGELWAVNTLFSCLATFDDHHSFVPRWQPQFITALAPEDRCHLNGLALVDGTPRYVTALGTTDTKGGWRADKARGGVLIDIDTDEIIASGLSMPHSPRWHDGRLWVLESGHGGLATVDVTSGEVTTVAELPGFTRGLSFAGPYAFVGLSQVRDTLFEGVPIKERADRACGVWVVDTRNGRIVTFLRFEGVVQELFDVQVLAGVRLPDLAEPGDERVSSSYVLPDAALARVPAALQA